MSISNTEVLPKSDTEVSTMDADSALVERVKAGDMSAFDTLTRKYRERLFSAVYNMLANKEDSMDIVQESFIKAFTSISSFRGGCAFYTWLYRIAINRAITFLKRARLRRFFSFENIQEEVAPSDVLEKLTLESGGSRAATLSELREKLNESLQTLSIKHRTVVILHEIEGLSHEEIAEIVGTTPATVRTRLHYAKRQLQILLKDYVDTI